MTLDALLTAITARDAATALTLVDANPALLSQRSAAGLSPLGLAAYTGQNELLTTLKTRHTAPDFFDSLIAGDTMAIERHLAAGQQVNQRAPDGFTPLGLAVFFGHPALAQRLLDAGADVNARADNPQRVAALHAAVARRDVEMVAILLARGATVDLTQQQGITPLHAAAAAGRDDLVQLLLQAGADPRRADDEGRDAAEHARQHGHAAMAEALTR